MQTLFTIAAVIGFILNLVALLGVYTKLAIMTYQHRLMWIDYTKRKNINTEDN